MSPVLLVVVRLRFDQPRVPLNLMGVPNRPSESFDQLAREMPALEIGRVDALAKHDRAVSVIGRHSDVGHPDLLRSGSHAGSHLRFHPQ
jgi:hypothetical protein